MKIKILSIMILGFVYYTQAQQSSNLGQDIKQGIQNEINKVTSQINQFSTYIQSNPNLTEDAKNELEKDIQQQVSSLKSSFQQIKKLKKEGKLTQAAKNEFKQQIRDAEKQLKNQEKQLEKASKAVLGKK